MKDELLSSLSIRRVPRHINYIFTVNTQTLYLSCNKTCKKKLLFNLIIKKDNGNLIDTSMVVPVRGVELVFLPFLSLAT
jgi:hypothetical protein